MEISNHIERDLQLGKVAKERNSKMCGLSDVR